MVPQNSAGNHFRAEWDLRASEERASQEDGQILVLCHMDTVWPVGEIARRPFRIEAGRAYGPGVFDMKGGIVLGYYAVKIIRELALPTKLRTVFLFTSDEEVQSHTSREMIEYEAKRSKYVLCLEPSSSPSGSVKTSRKGVATFTMEIVGKATHAGIEPEKGVSAVQELANQILKLHSLTDYEKGTTVNVGVVSGGSRPNVVAASARAMIDLRFSTVEEGERMARIIRGLASSLPGASVSVSGGIDRPTMVRSPQIVALYSRARDIAAGLGFRLDETSSGGASDGNFTAALGIPTLDGLGPVGDGAHTTSEYVVLDSFPPRTALVAELLRVLR